MSETINYLNTNRFNKGNDTIEAIKNKLIKKHGKENVENVQAAIRMQREITEMLVKKRKSMHINQEELAVSTDTTRQQISKYENNQQAPTLTKLIKICEQLGIEVAFKDKEDSKVLYHT